ncbi:MAG: hypothetical protein V2B20_05805 [Pseudomonadota bacterium]
MQCPELSKSSFKHLWIIIPPFLTLVIIGSVQSTPARDYKIGAGLTIGYEGYSRQYDKDESTATVSEQEGTTTTTSGTQSDDIYNRLRISPHIIVSSVSAHDELSLRYSPGFRYNVEIKDHDVDQNLNAAYTYKYSVTRDWLLKLTEYSLVTDNNIEDNSNATDTAVKLSDNAGRRQYWTNDLGFISEYSYRQDSLFSLGYTFGSLKNIDVDSDSNYEDYNRHAGSMSVGHRFDSIWKITTFGSYVRGLFDVAGKQETTTVADTNSNKDLSEYRGSMMLESRLIEHNPLSLSYSFLEIDYDADDQKTITLHDLTAGWQWEISKYFRINLGGGPSFQKTDGKKGNWGYNANAKVQYMLERGAIGWSVNRGYDVQNFTGTDENGLREFWESRIDFNHEIIQDVSFRMFTLYRYEDREEITKQSVVAADSETTTAENQIVTETDIINRQRFSAGTSLGYKFAHWYSINLSYNYLLQNSEKANDSYDEHRLVLSLSVEKDLLKW